MKPNWSLVVAGYALGFFCMMPLMETVLALWPFNLGNLDWRFGALGRVSQNTITPLLGLALMITLAGWQNHRKAMVALSVVAVVGALSAVAFAGLFTLDMMAVRPRVAADLMPSFNTTGRVALLRLGLSALVAGFVSWGGWMAFSRGKAHARPSEQQPGVVASARQS